MRAYLHWLVCHKPTDFANGRAVRNVFEETLTNQTNSLAKLDKLAVDTRAAHSSALHKE